MINYKKDKFDVKKIVQKKDYFQEDRMALYQYIAARQEEYESKHQKMKSIRFS